VEAGKGAHALMRRGVLVFDQVDSEGANRVAVGEDVQRAILQRVVDLLRADLLVTESGAE
jgi:hypothetical protein